jgi:hypothetical protein
MAKEENLIEVSIDPSSIFSIAHRVHNGRVIGALDTVILKVPKKDYDEYLSAQATCIDFICQLIDQAKTQKKKEISYEPIRG